MEKNHSRLFILSLLWLRNPPLYPVLNIVAAPIACCQILTAFTSMKHTLSQAIRERFFFGSLAKLRKATISFVASVRLSVRVKQRGSYWTDFHEIWYFSIFRKSNPKIKFSLISDKNNGHFRWKTTDIIYHASLNASCNEKRFGQNSYRNQNTHVMFNSFFFSKIVPFMTKWKNILQPGRTQMAVLRMSIACFIPKATNTHSM